MSSGKMTEKTTQVLLVEDDDAYAMAVEAICSAAQSARYSITRTARLDAALALLARRQFDIILLDLGLPDRRGMSVFMAVHARAASTPIIVLTGQDDDSLALEAAR